MKKFISFVLAILILSTIFSFAHASTTPTETTAESLKELLKTANKETISDFLDPSLFDSSMNDVELSDQPILLLTSCPFIFVADLAYDEAVEYALNNFVTSVIVMDDDPFYLRKYNNQSQIGVGGIATNSYVYDILEGSVVQTFLNHECAVTNVICFEAYGDRLGATVVFETTEGLFVRYYEFEDSEPLEYAWADFVKIAQQYFDYRFDPERQYGPNGEPLNGREMPLTEFAMHFTNNTQTPTPPNNQRSLWVAVISLFLLAFGVLVCYAYSKARQRRKQSSEI